MPANVPESHGMAAVKLFVAHDEPGGHVMQDEDLVVGPKLPGPHGRQSVEPSVAANVPVGHGTQSVAAVAPSLVRNVPATHNTHGSLGSGFAPFQSKPEVSVETPLNEPAGQVINCSGMKYFELV